MTTSRFRAAASSFLLVACGSLDSEDEVPDTAASQVATITSYGRAGRADLTVGQRVFHCRFGYGTIAAIDNNKLEVDFAHVGRKKILDTYVSVTASREDSKCQAMK